MTRRIDRSACRERVCACHDDAAWVPGVTYAAGCSACGCRWGAPVPAGGERYEGEQDVLFGALTKTLPDLAVALEASDPLLALAEHAIRSGDLARLRVALAAVSEWAREAHEAKARTTGPRVH